MEPMVGTELSPSSESPILSEQVVRSLTRLALATQFEPSRELIALMLSSLQDLPMETLMEVLNDWTLGYPVPGIALEDLKFFPRIAQLRLASSLTIRGTATDAWELVLAYLGRHGVGGTATYGLPIYDPNRPDIEIGREPPIVAPYLQLDIVRAIEALGGGDRRRGLKYIHTHPHFNGWEPSRFKDSPHRVGDAIERKFRQEYEKAVIQSETGR